MEDALLLEGGGQDPATVLNLLLDAIDEALFCQGAFFMEAISK